MAEIATIEQAIELVRQNCFALEQVPANLKTPSVCFAAYKHSAYLDNYADNVLKHVPKNLKDVIELAGRQVYESEEFTDDDVCILALGAGCDFDMIPKPYQTIYVCIEAVRQGNTPIEDIPENLRNEVISLTTGDSP